MAEQETQYGACNSGSEPPTIQPTWCREKDSNICPRTNSYKIIPKWKYQCICLKILEPKFDIDPGNVIKKFKILLQTWPKKCDQVNPCPSKHSAKWTTTTTTAVKLSLMKITMEISQLEFLLSYWCKRSNRSSSEPNYAKVRTGVNKNIKPWKGRAKHLPLINIY